MRVVKVKYFTAIGQICVMGWKRRRRSNLFITQPTLCKWDNLYPQVAHVNVTREREERKKSCCLMVSFTQTQKDITEEVNLILLSLQILSLVCGVLFTFNDTLEKKKRESKLSVYWFYSFAKFFSLYSRLMCVCVCVCRASFFLSFCVSRANRVSRNQLFYLLFLVTLGMWHMDNLC